MIEYKLIVGCEKRSVTLCEDILGCVHFFTIPALSHFTSIISSRNMHTSKTVPLAGCLAFLVNDAIVHAATSSPSISGASVNPSTITGTGFTISTATDTSGRHQVGDEILGINDPSKYDSENVQLRRRLSNYSCAACFVHERMKKIMSDTMIKLLTCLTDKLEIKLGIVWVLLFLTQDFDVSCLTSKMCTW